MYRRNRLIRHICLLFIPGWVGCSDSGAAPPDSRFSVRDSAGITIVMHSNAGREDVPIWRLEPDPELVIGQAEGEEAYVLFAVAGGTVLDNGSTVVMMELVGVFELRYYDPKGAHLATVGRWGEGPWEMHFVHGLYHLPGDSVLVVGKDHRYAVFGPEGGQVREGRLSLAPFGSGWWSAMVDPERFAFQTGVRSGPRWGLLRYEDLYRIHDLTTGTTDTIARLGGSMQLNESTGVGRSRQYPFPFSPGSKGAAGSGLVWVGQSDIPEIRGFGSDGRLRTLLRLDPTPREVTAEDRRRFEEWMKARWGENANLVPSALRRMGYPEAMPYFEDLKVDRVGNLWIRRYEPPWHGSAQEWDGYDPSGRWMATLRIPEGILSRCGGYAGLCPEFMEIGHDYILVEQWDSLDVERVVRYRLIKEP